MKAAESARLTELILAALPGSRSEIAVAVGRKRTDGTVRRRLERLRDEGVVERADGQWRVCQTGPPVEGRDWPEHFDDISRRELMENVAAWIEADVWDDSDIELTERYVGACQRARLANAALRDEGLTTTGSQGQTVAHPLVTVARQAERDAQDYEELLRDRFEAAGALDDDGDRGDQEGL